MDQFYKQVAEGVYDTMTKMEQPLTDDQYGILLGSLSVWLDEEFLTKRVLDWFQVRYRRIGLMSVTKFAWFPVTGVYDTGHRMYNAIYWLQHYTQYNGHREAKKIGFFSYRGKCFSVGRLYGD